MNRIQLAHLGSELLAELMGLLRTAEMEILHIYRHEASDRVGYFTGGIYRDDRGRWRRGSVYVDQDFSTGIVFRSGAVVVVHRRAIANVLQAFGLREVT